MALYLGRYPISFLGKPEIMKIPSTRQDGLCYTDTVLESTMPWLPRSGDVFPAAFPTSRLNPKLSYGHYNYTKQRLWITRDLSLRAW